jgi:hypothetical protein
MTGAVLRDVAVSIAGGAENLAGTAVLRNQGGCSGRWRRSRRCGDR